MVIPPFNFCEKRRLRARASRNAIRATSGAFYGKEDGDARQGRQKVMSAVMEHAARVEGIEQIVLVGATT